MYFMIVHVCGHRSEGFIVKHIIIILIKSLTLSSLNFPLQAYIFSEGKNCSHNRNWSTILKLLLFVSCSLFTASRVLVNSFKYFAGSSSKLRLHLHVSSSPSSTYQKQLNEMIFCSPIFGTYKLFSKGLSLFIRINEPVLSFVHLGFAYVTYLLKTSYVVQFQDIKFTIGQRNERQVIYKMYKKDNIVS